MKSHAQNAHKIGASKVADSAPSRRVQIFNNSEEFAPDENKQLTVYSKPESSRTFLRNALTVHYLFESLGESDMERIIDCVRPMHQAAGDFIIKQGDLGDLFFCLETGKATATVEGVGTVMEYEPGGCFGELALIYNSPRAASVMASSQCKLWALDLR